MSEIKVNSIKGVAASSAALTIHNTDGSVTIPTPDIPDKANYNLLINGQFDIWQRGTDSGSNTDNGILACDRWVLNSSGATKQVTRQSFAAGQTDVPSNPQYYLRYAVTTGNNNCGIAQRIEDVRRVQGAVTLSFWAKGTNPAGGHFSIIHRQDFGTGGSPSNVVDTGIGDWTVTSSWTKYTFTFTPASISGKTLGTNNNSFFQCELFRQPADDTGTAAYTVDIANVKLEYGSYATDYQRINVGQELALCQRYYYEHANGSIDGSGSGETSISESCTFYNSSSLFTSVFPPVTMRAKPTLEIATGSAYYIHFSNGSSNGTFSGTGVAMVGGESRTNLAFRTNEANGTNGHAGIWRTSNASAKIAFNAEL